MLKKVKKNKKETKEKESKIELIALVAHQLRAPLIEIKWNLKMMLDGSFGEITEKQRKFLVKNFQSNERMIKLVDSFLDISKIELLGRRLYSFKKESIIKIIDEAVENLKDKIKEKNLQFNFLKPKEEIPKIEADREKILICVNNLLDNAIKYTNPGGRVIISLKYDKNKKEIVFWVRDNGIGIPEKQHNKIFEKFYRSTTAIKNQTEGVGLGLYITKRIIEDHHGTIWFRSKEGRGSVFYFTLPVAQ